jgi:raffinose/stachyose/melibiose transport system permease protein
LFDYRHGTINGLLDALGLANLKFQWLGSRWPGVFAICCAEVWRNVGYAVVITLAGLQSLNSNYIEAAMVDGAKGWKLFINIT